ncbi:hypothetical protein OTU49_017336, partial [Cherax quadricarinatus]
LRLHPQLATMKTVSLVLCVAVVSWAAPQGDYNYQAPSQQGPQYSSSPAQYNYQWEVNDEYSANYYGHREQREGDNTQGSYYVRLPDTRIMRVDYYADSTGYHPSISFEGEAQFPSDSTRGYSQPASGPRQVFSQPAEAPRQTYSQPAEVPRQTYSQPAPGLRQTHSQPAPGLRQTYSQPAPALRQTYSQPTSAAPRQVFSQPSASLSPTYSQPASPHREVFSQPPTQFYSQPGK